MTVSTLIIRETLISIVINCGISVGACLLVFGLDRPVPASPLAWNFLPQSFMIALMGSLVPALLLRKRLNAGVGDIVRCSIAMAIGAAVIIGGVAAVLTQMLVERSMAAGSVLLLNATFGAILAALVTPSALIVLARKSGIQI